MTELIKRDDALEAIKTAELGKEYDEVEKVPSVNAMPVVHGRWKDYPDCGVTVCSACGWSIEECFYDPTTLKPYPYCPNCGARMDGGKDDN